MEVRIILLLPRDETSVLLVRHLCRYSLEQLNVSSRCTSDIEIAVSEACTNVLRHAGGTGAEYEVHVRIDQSECEISVVDTGDFDAGTLPRDHPSLTAEGGRGVFLMRALVDSFDFVSDSPTGTVVRLRKSLEFAPGPRLGTRDDPRILEKND